MQPVLDNQRMREADRHTIEDLGVPSIVLMENAAAGVVEALREAFPDARDVVVVCGRGNNGGDGLAIARQLAIGGHDVTAVVVADPDTLSGDPALELELGRRFEIPLEFVVDDDLGVLDRLLDGRPDVVVDALLGTGLDRPLGGRLATIAEKINATDIPVVAVDVPTGLSGSSAEVPGPVLEADLTVTFAALKTCHVLPPACHHCGEVAVAEIGIPPGALESTADLWWVEADDIALMLPVRDRDGHKGRFGHVLVVAGAMGRGGAVAMAARAAVAVGAGLVTMAVPEPLVQMVDGACLEAMTLPVAADPEGAFGDLEGAIPDLGRFSVIAMGPGMGTGIGAAEGLAWVLGQWHGPLVFDADAINLLAGEPERLAGRDVPPILTPHPGELGRLLGWSTEDVVGDRLSAAREAARRSGSVVVAKGYRTIVAAPDGEAYINPPGDAHLGSGGSGDVLTGTIAALLAQGLEPIRAALVGCWLHGRGGELADNQWPAAVPASQLPAWIMKAWRELER